MVDGVFTAPERPWCCGTSREQTVNKSKTPGAATYLQGMTLTSVTGKSVLIVDDEPMVREVVAAYLERDGFRVVEAGDGAAALTSLAETTPDLVLLDVMIPKVDGFSILRSLRQNGDIPVILLTARGDEADRILGLELGADDYIVKPFSPRELAARVRTVLRRVGAPTPLLGDRLDFGELVIEPGTREVEVRGVPVATTPKEFDLLHFMASHPRQVFTRGQLLEQVWDSSSDWQDTSTVTVHIRRLRTKIEEKVDQPRWITTVWGIGYRFEQ